MQERLLGRPRTQWFRIRDMHAVEMHAVGHAARITLHGPRGIWHIDGVRARSAAVLQEQVDAAMHGETPAQTFEATAPDPAREREQRLERLRRHGSMTAAEAAWARRKQKK